MEASSNAFKAVFHKVLGPSGGHYASMSVDGMESNRSNSNMTWSRKKTLGISSVCAVAAFWFLYTLSGHRGAFKDVESPCSYAKHVVYASTHSQNISWVNQIPSDWTVKRYMMDEKFPDPSVGLPVPRLYGREAMAYLTYIIDNYDCLPKYTAFVHGHERSWHQIAPISAKIRALNLTALDRENYISFRCEDAMGCERKPYIDTLHVNWEGETHMREFFQHILPNEAPPRYVSYKCCGQHAVTARAIQARSREDWISIRAPLLREENEMERHEAWAREPVITEWLLGAWLEKYWHIFFGMSSEHCPSLEQCRQEHFSNAIVCDGDRDTTPYEGDLWEDVTCRTAFDGVPPNSSPNWTEWYASLPGLGGALREDRAKVVKAQKDRLAFLEDEYQKQLEG